MVADERLTALQKLAEHPVGFKALELLVKPIHHREIYCYVIAILILLKPLRGRLHRSAGSCQHPVNDSRATTSASRTPNQLPPVDI